MANTSESIELSDFRAGIHADFHGGIVSTSRGAILANGAAVLDGTFACCADESGALVPLPGVAASKSDTTIFPAGTAANPLIHPAGQPQAMLTDAYISPGSTDVTGGPTNGNIGTDGGANISVLYQHFTAFDSLGTTLGYKHAWLGRMYRNGRGTPDAIDFLWQTGTTLWQPVADFPKQFFSGVLNDHRSATASPVVAATAVITALAAAVQMSTAATGAIPANQAAWTTFETDISANFPALGVANAAGFLISFPNPDATASAYTGNTVAVNTGGVDGSLVAPNLATSHQGRLAVTDITTTQSGALNYYGLDAVFYTRVQDFKGLGGTPFKFAPGPENMSGIGALASTNTDELLIIKHRGGAILVRGDLDRPTVVRLPGVESTYGVCSSPVNTPQGLVYGTRNGVFLWSGGQTAEKVSKQIEGFFWEHAGSYAAFYAGHRGRFAYMHPYVAIPNNFILDMRTNGWWRLVDTSSNSSTPYNVYCTNPNTGDLYAFPYKIDANTQKVWDRFSAATLASSYSWRSQPLVETLDRQYNFTDITLVASTGANTAAATITITLTGYDKTGQALTPVDTVFTLPASSGTGQPVIMREDIRTNFNAMYVQVKIVATTASGAAPKIIKALIGHGSRSRSPKAL